MTLRKLFIILLACSFVLSCKKDNNTANSEYLPIIFVHGYLGSGDSYEWMAKRFTSNGYPADKLFTFDWNTFSADNADTKALENFVSDVLQKTRASKVHLVGHSLGGGLVYNFCKDPFNAGRVATLSMIAPYLSDRSKLPDAGIRTLNIWPDTDYVVTDGAAIPGADNVTVSNKDHNEIAACDETFIALYSLVTGQLPTTKVPTFESAPVISGKVVSFVENKSGAGATVEVYEVDPLTGFRKSVLPQRTFTVGDDNSWGPMTADPTAYYEFKVFSGKAGDKPLHYYREPFTHSDHLVYLRLFPPAGSILNGALDLIVPTSNTDAVGIFYSTSKALWLGRDQISVNGVSLASPTFIEPEMNTIAMFLFDANSNGNSDTTSVLAFEAFQSLKGVDFHLPANDPESITYNFNGRILHTVNWRSKTEGIGVAVFE